jgi:hypothetical protein
LAVSPKTGIFYNNEGLISRMEEAGLTLSALYTERKMPRYLERPVVGGPELPDGIETAAGRYNFQWDEAGRLVRLSGNSLDCRYEYTLDSRGNWTERREIIYESMDSMDGEEKWLIPVGVETIRRLILYEAQN